MCTAHLPTIPTSVAKQMAAPGGSGPQVNKFEKVSRSWHQISLAWEVRGPCAVGSAGEVRVKGWLGQSLYGVFQFIMGNSHMGPYHWQTDVTENIPFLQMFLQAVTALFLGVGELG